MTNIDDLDLGFSGDIPIHDGVPYMAEGHHVSHVTRDGFIITDGGRRDTCRSHHDWSNPEGAEPSYICWNCDVVKFPSEVLLDD